MTETSETPAFLLVKIAGCTPPVFLVIDYAMYDHGDGYEPEHMTYFVEQHTCPTNLVPVERFLVEGDSDPHGVLEFVAHAAKPDDWPEDQNTVTYDRWCELFPVLPGGIVNAAPVAQRLLLPPAP